MKDITTNVSVVCEFWSEFDLMSRTLDLDIERSFLTIDILAHAIIYTFNSAGDSMKNALFFREHEFKQLFDEKKINNAGLNNMLEHWMNSCASAYSIMSTDYTAKVFLEIERDDIKESSLVFSLDFKKGSFGALEHTEILDDKIIDAVYDLSTKSHIFALMPEKEQIITYVETKRKKEEEEKKPKKQVVKKKEVAKEDKK